MWNVTVKPGKYVKQHSDWKPLTDGDADKIKGVCGRPEVGIRYKNVFSRDGKYKVIQCHLFSDRGLSGHMDFASLLQSDGTPYGGNIPDPVTPDAAFH